MKAKTKKIALVGVALAAAGAIGYYIYKKRSAAAVSGLGLLAGGGHHHGGHHGGHGYGGGYGIGYGPGWGWGNYAIYSPPATIDPCYGRACPAGYVADPRNSCRCTKVVL